VVRGIRATARGAGCSSAGGLHPRVREGAQVLVLARYIRFRSDQRTFKGSSSRLLTAHPRGSV